MDKITRILDAARQKGILQADDLEAMGISRNYLSQLCQDGRLRKVFRELYALADAPVTEHSSLAEVATRVPNSVVCLISALVFHGLTTQIPHEIWIAVPRSSWRPAFVYPPLNLTYLSGDAYTFGATEHQVDGITIKVYTSAKTVADCFKFRSKVGLDVAIEALREVWRARKATMNELTAAAGIYRMSKVMRPYLEAIV